MFPCILDAVRLYINALLMPNLKKKKQQQKLK